MSSNQKQKQGKGGGGGAAKHSGGMRAEAKKMKVVFKNVLNTPFNIPWYELVSERYELFMDLIRLLELALTDWVFNAFRPVVSNKDNTIVLNALCDLMKPIRDYHNIPSNKPVSKKDMRTRKKATQSSQQDTPKAPKPNTALAEVSHDSQAPSLIPTQPSTTPSEPPSAAAFDSVSQPSQTPAPLILKSTTIGINAVTKSLERSIQDIKTYPPPKAIFLCKGDLQPAHLYNHLGPMTAMLPDILLFPLMKSAEKRLSEALGMQAVGALAIHFQQEPKQQDKGAGVGAKDEESRNIEDLIMILSRMVEPMIVPWLPKVKPLPEPKTKPATTPTAKDKYINTQVTVPTKEKTEAGITEIGERAVKTSSSASAKPTADESIKSSASWIPTNIKTVRTEMPIIVKSQKPPAALSDKQNQAGSNKNKNNNGKRKDSQQPAQQQQQQQQTQPTQNKVKKHPASSAPDLEADRGKGKKPKIG
ncbi:hypothetical protein BG011_008640 [Mortierella polycephala]|uniref:Uncharacterized protein n=1 Tax=Mortierella polycephala TaxID=41804 RepID=A0A9P6PQS8_9FUNG|nr:hypothetical protein BG011_008640 [Mortierella polycephala]